MNDASGDDKPLPRPQINRAIFQVDQETTVDDVEKLVQILVGVPMVLALHNAKSHNRIVHTAKCLVIPFVGAGIDELLNVNDLQRLVQNIQIGLVWKILLSLF